MKTFLLDIIPSIKRFSKKFDDLTVITNKNWLLIDQESTEKIIFIFRKNNNQLLISKNGKVEKGTWEYIGNNSLLIDRESGSYLFKHGFVDDSVLALKVDGKDEYALFANEGKLENLKSLDNILSFLRNEYLEKIEEPINTISIEVETNQPIKEIPNEKRLNYTLHSNCSETDLKLLKKDTKWGYIDKNNNVVIGFLFDDAFPFSEGLACVSIEGKKGFINRKGEVVIDAVYDSATYFKNGQSEVKIGDESFCINLKGEKIMD